jgi:hypothetical protein
MSVLLKVSYATITVIIFNFLGYREMENLEDYNHEKEEKKEEGESAI